MGQARLKQKIRGWLPPQPNNPSNRLRNYSVPITIGFVAVVLSLSLLVVFSGFLYSSSAVKPIPINTDTNYPTNPTPKPTLAPSSTVTQTPKPTSQATVMPSQDTPPTTRPNPTIPGSIITYCEINRNYNASSDITRIQIRIIIKSQAITDGQYGIYITNFYLSEYGSPVPNQVNKGVTSKVPLITNASILTEPIFEVAGNYTSSGYNLSYDNFPIEISLNKEQSSPLV
jgi:hypothetical protein